MTFKELAGNRPEDLSIRIFNADTVTLPFGTPVMFKIGASADLKVDGRNVARPSQVNALGLIAGIISNPQGVAINALDNAKIGGVIQVPVIANTRANTGVAYGAQGAVAANTGLTIDTTNDLLTGLTVVAPTTSNWMPFILLDAIAANTGQGTTPATGLFLTVTVRVLVRIPVV